jgi:beta-galactosidase
LAFPVNHIEDLRVVTILDDDYMDAVLKVHVKLSNKMKIELQLFDATQHVIASVSTTPDGLDFTFEVPIETPEKWSCDNPYLYRLVLSYPDGSITQRVGFRCVEIKNGILLVNGMRIVFRGVNRHEHHPESGRAVPLEFLKKDLMLMKRFNINAIRTCHQPSAPELYDLADELGLWIIDEADVECHGFEEIQEAALTPKERELTFKEKKVLTRTKAAEWTTNNPEWEAAYLDRAKQLIYRDKNHPCVILWSMGNEAFYGRNFKAMYDLIKSYDDTRPVHYEADHEAISADVYSCMYPEVDEMIDFVSQKEHQFKPLILCEFIHSMGNGPGGIKEYVDAFYKYSNLQGGCAWEWANHVRPANVCISTRLTTDAYRALRRALAQVIHFMPTEVILEIFQMIPTS